MTLAPIALLSTSSAGWVTISQSRFGAQIEGIQAQMHGEISEGDLHIQQRMGYIWTMPEDVDDDSGLGGRLVDIDEALSSRKKRKAQQEAERKATKARADRGGAISAVSAVLRA